jgi:hypothetical protein
MKDSSVHARAEPTDESWNSALEDTATYRPGEPRHATNGVAILFPLLIPAFLLASSSVSTTLLSHPDSFNFDICSSVTRPAAVAVRSDAITLNEARHLAIQALLNAERRRAIAAEAEARFYLAMLEGEGEP